MKTTDTNNDWKCQHCGSTTGTWFSRVEPMGYICEDCGKSVDEEHVVVNTEKSNPVGNNHIQNKTMKTIPHTFTITPLEGISSPCVNITISEESTLPECIEAFESFLHAVGYRLPTGAILGYEWDEDTTQ